MYWEKLKFSSSFIFFLPLSPFPLLLFLSLHRLPLHRGSQPWLSTINSVFHWSIRSGQRNAEARTQISWIRICERKRSSRIPQTCHSNQNYKLIFDTRHERCDAGDAGYFRPNSRLGAKASESDPARSELIQNYQWKEQTHSESTS